MVAPLATGVHLGTVKKKDELEVVVVGKGGW